MRHGIDFSNLSSAQTLERQTEWRERSVETIKASRTNRLQVLGKKRDAITHATEAYIQFDNAEVPWIGLSEEFVAVTSGRQAPPDEEWEPTEPTPKDRALRMRRDLRTRPPLTRVVHRQSNALSLYLTAVYVAHSEVRAGAAFTNNRHNLYGTKDRRSGWITLAGLSAPRDVRARRARMRRALDELVAANLAKIDTPGAPGRYERWSLLADDGSGSVYRVPSERGPRAVRLPAAFFVYGWHLVLTPGEMAMLLTIMHRGEQLRTEPGPPPWISLPRHVRHSIYGISGEMYLHAQQLVEFGLVEISDPMPHRRRGKIRFPKNATTSGGRADGPSAEDDSQPLPYEFRLVDPTVFNKDAFRFVDKTLSALPVPHRLHPDAAFVTPQHLVESHYEAN